MDSGSTSKTPKQWMNLSQAYKGHSTSCPKFEEQDIVALEVWGSLGESSQHLIEGEDEPGEGEVRTFDNYCRT